MSPFKMWKCIRTFHSSLTRCLRNDGRMMSSVCSLGEISRACGKIRIENVNLSNSSDLQCKNMMCERVGMSCLCKLSLACERLPHVKRLDLSHNGLEHLPEALWKLSTLEELYLHHNAFKEIPKGIEHLQSLKILHVYGNPFHNSQKNAALLNLTKLLPHLHEFRINENENKI